MPANVAEQDRLIREAGILNLIQTELGASDGLLHWAAVYVSPVGTSDLLLCAAYHECALPGYPRRDMCLLARNNIGMTYDGVSPPLTPDHLRFLAALAIGPEQHKLEYGRRFVYTGIAPVGEDLLYPAWTALEVETVTFGHVAFREHGFVRRSQVTALAFQELPSYPHD